MDSAHALVAKGRGIAPVSRAMSLSPAQLSLRVSCSADWQDRRSNRRYDETDAEILSDIHNIISNMRWCSDCFEFCCGDGEKLWGMFALDCCDREAIDWAASTGG